MKTARILAVCITFTALTGCQAMMYGTSQDLNKVAVGMSRTEVIGAIGEPTTVSADASKREEKLMYKRMPTTTGWLPRLYDVVLVDGKVVKYGPHEQ